MEIKTNMGLIDNLFQLWEDFAEAGELHIGKGFTENYEKIKQEILILRKTEGESCTNCGVGELFTEITINVGSVEVKKWDGVFYFERYASLGNGRQVKKAIQDFRANYTQEELDEMFNNT